MFEDLRNTGDDHWGPSSGVAPSQAIPLDDDDEDEGENEDDSDPDEVTPSARPKRGKSQGNAKGKKTKTSGGQWFQEQMGKLYLAVLYETIYLAVCMRPFICCCYYNKIMVLSLFIGTY